jgi:Tfp pilus assembly protein PilF
VERPHTLSRRRVNPREASTYLKLGRFCLQSGSPQDAADSFAEALTIDPESTAAREGLAQARSLSQRIHADVFSSKDPKRSTAYTATLKPI